jgi:chromate transport protein ChrA
MAGMTRRKIAFFLIGFGFGLVPSLVAILLVLASLHRTGHIGDYGWCKGLFVLPVLMMATGFGLLANTSKSN